MYLCNRTPVSDFIDALTKRTNVFECNQRKTLVFS